MGSVGRPMLGVELRLVDDRLEDVRPGAIGEIVYRGPMVMQGYLGRPDATEDAFAGGWFHSGDLATRDEDGYLWLVDRKKDMIVSGGENVYPAEVERVLRDHPAVADVAVIGVPHPRWVESPVAYVVVADGSPCRRRPSWWRTAAVASPDTRSRRRSTSWTSCPATLPARSPSASCAPSTPGRN